MITCKRIVTNVLNKTDYDPLHDELHNLVFRAFLTSTRASITRWSSANNEGRGFESQPGQVDFSLLVRYGSSLRETPHYYSPPEFAVP